MHAATAAVTKHSSTTCVLTLSCRQLLCSCAPRQHGWLTTWAADGREPDMLHAGVPKAT